MGIEMVQLYVQVLHRTPKSNRKEKGAPHCVASTVFFLGGGERRLGDQQIYMKSELLRLLRQHIVMEPDKTGNCPLRMLLFT